MRPSIIVMSAALLLGACMANGGPGVPGASPAPIVRYVPGDDAIEVVADGRVIRDVQVIGPRGALPASVSINQRDASQGQGFGGYAVPGVSVGLGAGRFSGGVGGAVFLLLPLLIPSPTPVHGAGGAGRSTARATLDDPRRYAAEWQRARVRVTFADGSEDFAAPAPN